MQDLLGTSTTGEEPDSSVTSVVEKLKGSSKNKKLMAQFEELFSKAQKDRTVFEKVWWTNLAFYFGRHYAQWASRGINDAGRMVEPKAPSWRVRLISNKIRPLIRGELAKVTQEKPQPYVIPSSSDDTDRMAARGAEAVFEYISEEVRFNKILRQTAFWALICGSGFIKDYWDKNKKDSSGNQGSICVERVSPFHIYVGDLAEEELEKQTFVIHAAMKPLSDVKAMYGDKAKGLKPDTSSTSNTSETKYRTAMGVKDQSNQKTDVLVKEIWIKPNYEHPEGLFAVWSNDTFLVEPTKWPYLYNDYPFTKIDHIPTGRFYGDSTIVDLIPLQKEYNRTRSQIIESKNRMSRPQLIAPRGSIRTSKVTSEPGLIIEYQPGFDPPQPLQMQNLPSYVIQEQDRIQMDMDDISAQHEVSKGQAPAGVEAATAISFLQEQDDAKFIHTVNSIEEATAQIGRHFLYHVKQFWTTPRQIKVMGTSGFIEAQSFQGSDLGNNVDLRVQAGSAAPRSRAAKQAFFMELGKLGWVDPNLLLKYLDMGETEKLHEELQIDSRQAQRENVKIRLLAKQFDESLQMGQIPVDPNTGQPQIPQVPVNDFDNHQMHIAEHNMFRKTEEFELLSPQAKMIFQNHVNLHKQYLMNQQGMMAPPGSPIPQELQERPGALNQPQQPGQPGPQPGMQ